MSGGVDSSVTAALLKRAGARVQGVFMALAQPDLDAQIARVKKIADFLAVPLAVVDMSVSFEQEVLAYFSASYFAGKTPNPCIVCNRKIKFGKLLDHVLDRRADLMATGHYARIVDGGEMGYRLLRGRDRQKDQSYFLCRLTQEQLARIRFPLGGYTKREVYGLAADLGLTGRHGAESQDVCFLKEQGVSGFLAGRRQGAPDAAGPIVTLAGTTIGRHDGIWHFTVGQRRGLGIPDATPYYVVGLDSEENRVIVGKESDLWREELTVREVNWNGRQPPELPCRLQVKIRYRHREAAAELRRDGSGAITVRFAEPQRAATPGQFAVFYDGEAVVGGGEIV